MSKVVEKVILARLSSPAVNEVRKIIQDWSISGVLDGAVWIDVSGVNEEIFIQDEQGVVKLTEEDWITKHVRSPKDLDFYLFQALVSPEEQISERDISKRISSLSSLKESVQRGANILVPVSDIGPLDPSSIKSYSPNIIFSPVSSSSPDAAYADVSSKSDGYYAHAAMSLASGAGLWKNQPKGHLDDFRSGAQAGQTPIAIARTFGRYVDASDLVGSIVRRSLTGGEGVLPQTFLDSGVQLNSVNDSNALQITDSIVKEFVQNNESQLGLKPLPKFKPSKRSARSVGQLLKEYVAFLGSLIKSPGDWAREKLAEISGMAAEKTQKAFLGKDSEYEVFVNGMSGLSKTSQDIDAAGQLVQAADSLHYNVERPAPPNPGNLWQDMMTVACSMADASEAPKSITMPGVSGGTRSVLRNPDYLAEDMDNGAFLIGASLPIKLAGAILRPDDPYLAMILHSQISEALKNPEKLTPSQLGDLQTAKHDLDTWIGFRRSLFWKVGLKIATELNKARQLFITKQEVFDDKKDLETLNTLEKRVRSSLRRTIVGALLLTLLGGLGWLAQAIYLNLQTGAWPTALVANWGLIALVFFALLLGWLGIGAAFFDRAVRELFAMRHKRNEARRKAEFVEEQRTALTFEIIRLGDLYSQYQAWVRALGPRLRDPLGLLVSSNAERESVKHTNDLPVGFGVAELSPEESSTESLIESVRVEFFSPGWCRRQILDSLRSQKVDIDTVWQQHSEDPAGKLSWLKGPEIRESLGPILGELATDKASMIATSKTDYQTWEVKHVGDASNNSRQCLDYLSEISAKSDQIPCQLVTAEVNVGNMLEPSPGRSSLLIDSRLKLSSQLPSESFSPFEDSVERGLDLMVIRTEITNDIPLDGLAPFKTSLSPREEEQLVEDSGFEEPPS
jgi:hypothetical protein